MKRCIGTPGDSLEIVDRTVLVNGNAFRFPDRSYPQYLYYVKTDGRGFSKSWLKKRLDINYLTNEEMRQYPTDQDVYQRTQDEYIMFLQSRHIEAISALENVKEVWPIVAQRQEHLLIQNFHKA